MPYWIGPGNFGDFFERPDPSHPAIVNAAKRGDLKKVRELVKRYPSRVDACRTRKEVEYKYGYSKSWTWNDDTALIAAARKGEYLIVLELLLAGASVSKNACPSDDVHETAKKAVENRVEKLKNPVFAPPEKIGADEKAALLQKYALVLQLLDIAEKEQAALAPPPAEAEYNPVLGDPPVKKTMGEMKVAELQNVLRNVGLPCTGLRWQLVERLTETYPDAINKNHKLLQKKYAEKKDRIEKEKVERAEKAKADKARAEARKEAAAQSLRECVVAAGYGGAMDAVAEEGGNGGGKGKAQASGKKKAKEGDSGAEAAGGLAAKRQKMG
eukprot:g20213.t1